MSNTEVDAGKAIVVNQLVALATQMGVTIDRVRWLDTDNGFDEGFFLLTAEIAGKERRARIEEEELEDVTSTSAVRTAIHMKLRNMLYQQASISS